VVKMANSEFRTRERSTEPCGNTLAGDPQPLVYAYPFGAVSIAAKPTHFCHATVRYLFTNPSRRVDQTRKQRCEGFRK
jgi:hypothetical protein